MANKKTAPEPKEETDENLEAIKTESARILQTDTSDKSEPKPETNNVTDSAPIKTFVSLESAYGKGFYSENKGGICSICGKHTMFKERTKCYKCYLESKK